MGRNIIYLHPHFTAYGGAGRFVLETCRRLAARGHVVKVISIRADEKITGDATKDVEFINIGGPLSSSLWFWLFFPWSCLRVFRILDRHHDFVLFPQVFPVNWWGALYKLLHKKVRLVWMCQEPSAFIHSKEWIASIKNPMMRLGARIFNSLLKAVDVKLAALPDRVMVNSEYTRGYARMVYGYTGDMIRTIYPGVEHNGEAGVKSLGGGELVMITVGRLTKFKNIDIIIKAMRMMLDRGYHVKLNIVGDGEEKANLVLLAEEQGLGNHVRFLGGVSQLQLDRLYAESQVYVSAALNEPFGLALLEAMSHGLPVLAINSGGPSEIVANGESGILIDHGLPSELAEAVKRLLREPGLCAKMSAASITRAEYFSWDKTVAGIERALDK